MKKLITGFLILLSTLSFSNGVNDKVKEVQKTATFTNKETVQKLDLQNKGIDPLLKVLNKYTNIQVTGEGRAIVNKENYLRTAIPYQDTVFNALLIKQDINPEILTRTGAKVQIKGDYYQGVVEGDTSSFVALQFIDSEINGEITTNGQSYIIGKLLGESRNIIYNNADLKAINYTTCRSLDIPGDNISKTVTSNITGDRCIQLYWETKYNLFQLKGSSQAVANYMAGVFNQVQALYLNDGIHAKFKTLVINDTTDTFAGPGTYDFLTQFQAKRSPLLGDINVLMGTTGGGGIAYVNALCSSYNYAYCMIQGNYSNVPTHSWTVEVIAHEQGHVMGSPHTHNCSWTLNGVPNQAIDGCAPSAGYGFEGGCTIPTTDPSYKPIGGGTIMSYCHLTSVGINFSLGFGPQPKALILDRIATRGCITACDTTSPPLDTCFAPVNLVAGNITNNSAKVTWGVKTGTTNNRTFTTQYKTTSATTWTTLPTSIVMFQNITGLTPVTQYQARVASNCVVGTSSYTSPVTFTTTSNPVQDSCKGIYKVPTISISGTTTVLPNTRVSIGTSISNQGTNPSYEWFLNNITTNTHTPVFSFTPVNNDKLYCVLTNLDSCFKPHVVTSTALVFNVNAANSSYITVCTKYFPDFKTTQYQFTLHSNTINTAYQWKNKAGAIVSTASSYNTPALSEGTVDEFSCIVTSNGISTVTNKIKIQ